MQFNAYLHRPFLRQEKKKKQLRIGDGDGS